MLPQRAAAACCRSVLPVGRAAVDGPDRAQYDWRHCAEPQAKRRRVPQTSLASTMKLRHAHVTCNYGSTAMHIMHCARRWPLRTERRGHCMSTCSPHASGDVQMPSSVAAGLGPPHLNSSTCSAVAHACRRTARHCRHRTGRPHVGAGNPHGRGCTRWRWPRWGESRPAAAPYPACAVRARAAGAASARLRAPPCAWPDLFEHPISFLCKHRDLRHNITGECFTAVATKTMLQNAPVVWVSFAGACGRGTWQ